jgi:uncharacterized protein YfiM (DUF2279 family)
VSLITNSLKKFNYHFSKHLQILKSSNLQILFLLILTWGFPAKAQDTLNFFEPAKNYDAKRGKLVAASAGSVYLLSMAGLYTLWYKDYPLSDFRRFDDSEEWLQMDKAGHFGSSYYLSKWGMDLTRWTGANKNRSILLGGSIGLAFLTSIEILDGFSSQWGFSSGDMFANVGGAAVAVSQQMLWDEQRIKVKFSYHETIYPAFRPDQLGERRLEKVFKDYNGQTYWLSANIKSLFLKNSKFPAWLNIAAGYGADRMTGAIDNDSPLTIGTPPAYRVRQLYIAPDIDLSRIKTNKHLLKILFNAFGFIKFPAPAIEFREKGKPVYHLLYF